MEVGDNAIGTNGEGKAMRHGDQDNGQQPACASAGREANSSEGINNLKNILGLRGLAFGGWIGWIVEWPREKAIERPD